MSNKPLKDFRTVIAPSVQLAVWQSERGGISFTIQKRYKEESGEWKDSKSLFAQDLAALKMLIDEAIAFANTLKKPQQPQAASSDVSYTPRIVPESSREPTIDDDDIPF